MPAGTHLMVERDWTVGHVETRWKRRGGVASVDDDGPCLCRGHLWAWVGCRPETGWHKSRRQEDEHEAGQGQRRRLLASAIEPDDP